MFENGADKLANDQTNNSKLLGINMAGFMNDTTVNVGRDDNTFIGRNDESL